METITRTNEQKKNSLEQKLELAKELGLVAQVEMIENEIQKGKFEKLCPYPEVTMNQAREAMCEPYFFKYERPGPITVFMNMGILLSKHACRWCWSNEAYGYFDRKEQKNLDDRDKTHEHHVFRYFLKKEEVGLGQKATSHFNGEGSVQYEVREITELPMAAMLRLKEAKDKNLFSSFEIWRPESMSEKEARLHDPWLVGVFDNRYFKLCDWR